MEKYFGSFRELFRKVFRKIVKIKSFRKISEYYFGKLSEIFLEVSRNIAEILGFILKNFKTVLVKFNNYCGEF